LAAQETLSEAGVAAAEALDYDRKNLGTFNSATQSMLRTFAGVLRRSGKKQQAYRLLEDDLDWGRALFPEDDGAVAKLLCNLGWLRMEDGYTSDGLATFVQGMDMYCRLYGPNNPHSRMLLREALLATLGSRNHLPDGKLGAQAFCALEDIFRDNPLDLPAPGAVSSLTTRYKLMRWLPDASQTIAEGTLAQVSSVSDLSDGIYLLSLEIPAAGSKPIRQAMWLLVSHWHIAFYDGRGIGEFCPRSWPAISASNHIDTDSPGLAFMNGFKHRPLKSSTHFGLTATTSIDLPAGRYRFTTSSDDGVRLYVDGQRVINAWSTHAARRDFADLELDAGKHELKVEYFEEGDRFELWVRVEPQCAEAATLVSAMGGHPLRTPQQAIEQEGESLRPEARSARGCVYAQMGRFKGAAEDYAAAVDLDPGEPLWFQQSALISLQMGDLEKYRWWRDRIPPQAPDNFDCVTAARSIIVSMLDPQTPDDQKAEVLLADARLESARPSQRAVIQLARGVSDYHASRYDAAIRSLTEASAGRLTAEARATAEFFRAMALQQQGNKEEAASAFLTAQRSLALLQTAQGPELDATELQDRLVCQIAARMAEATIGRGNLATKPAALPARAPHAIAVEGPGGTSSQN
jgi:tetratricopeptide (TPR) repeat protein